MRSERVPKFGRLHTEDSLDLRGRFDSFLGLLSPPYKDFKFGWQANLVASWLAIDRCNFTGY